MAHSRNFTIISLCFANAHGHIHDRAGTHAHAHAYDDACAHVHARQLKTGDANTSICFSISANVCIYQSNRRAAKSLYSTTKLHVLTHKMIPVNLGMISKKFRG